MAVLLPSAVLAARMRDRKVRAAHITGLEVALCRQGARDIEQIAAPAGRVAQLHRPVAHLLARARELTVSRCAARLPLEGPEGDSTPTENLAAAQKSSVGALPVLPVCHLTPASLAPAESQLLL